MGDPSIDASPDGSVVAMANQAPTQAGGEAALIVVSLSFDGGRTFNQSELVNDDPALDCGGSVDQAWLSFSDWPDAAGLPNFWVAFRDKKALVDGVCLRGASVNPATHIVSWFGPALSVGGLHAELGYGQGGVILRPGPVFPEFDGRVLELMYASSDQMGREGAGTCASSPGAVAGVAWYVADILARGIDRPDYRLETLANTPLARADLGCSVSGVQPGIRDFGFDLGRDGWEFAAVPSPDGRAVQVYRRQAVAGLLAWFVGFTAGPPPWIADSLLGAPVAGSKGQVFWPTVACDGSALVTFGSTVSGSSSSVAYFVSASAEGVDGPVGTFTPPLLLSDIAPSAGSYVPAELGRDGDYMAVAVSSPADYLVAWTRTFPPATTAAVATSAVSVRRF